MLRTVLSSLCVVLALSVPCLAEQAGGSGLPPPATAAEWQKAMQLRLRANAFHRIMALGKLERGINGEAATIAFNINPDGRIADVAIIKASNGLTQKTQRKLVKAFETMPRMPPFSPDMAGKSYHATLSMRIN